MIIRAAAGRKIPHNRVFEGEKLYFMKKGRAKTTVTAMVKSVQNHVNLYKDEINTALADNQEKLNLYDKQIKRWHKKCMCLVEFENLEEIVPLEFEKQSNMDDWLIIDNPIIINQDSKSIVTRYLRKSYSMYISKLSITDETSKRD